MWLFCIILFSSSSAPTHSSIFVAAANKISGNTMMTSRPRWKRCTVTKVPPLWTSQLFIFVMLLNSSDLSVHQLLSHLIYCIETKWDSLVGSTKHITDVYSIYTVNFVVKIVTYSSNEAQRVRQDLFSLSHAYW